MLQFIKKAAIGRASGYELRAQLTLRVAALCNINCKEERASRCTKKLYDAAQILKSKITLARYNCDHMLYAATRKVQISPISYGGKRMLDTVSYLQGKMGTKVRKR